MERRVAWTVANIERSTMERAIWEMGQTQTLQDAQTEASPKLNIRRVGNEVEAVPSVPRPVTQLETNMDQISLCAVFSVRVALAVRYSVYQGRALKYFSGTYRNQCALRII
eukprot:IDg12147t1